jgi:cation:H+ antiporter
VFTLDIIMVNLLILIFFLVVMDFGSRMIIHSSIKISEITGIGKATIGFLLLAFSTSLPELSVGVVAPLTGEAAISVGNVLGTNVVNVCLIIGVAVLLVSLRRPRVLNTIPRFAKEELSSLYFGLFIASVIPLSLVYVAGAMWLVGLILMAVFVVYSYQMLKISIPRGEIENRNALKSNENVTRHVILTVIGIFVVIISSYWMVQSSVAIAELTGVSKTIIGATVIAFGTSLPEFSLTVRAFLKNQAALGLGIIIGSGFINITLILGATFFIPMLIGSSLTLNMFAFQGLIIFSLISNLFLWYFLSMEKLSWKEGALLLFIYLLFLANTLGLIQLQQAA